MSAFLDIQTAPPVEVFALTQAFKEDPHPNKVNLTVGAYRTDDTKPWVLPVVRTVESQMAADETLDKEYLPISGLVDFTQAGIALCLGEGSPLMISKRADAVQALGGTGALRIACEFLSRLAGRSILYVSKPTWGNHHGIGKQCGMEVREYRYWDPVNRCVDMAGLLEDLGSAPDGSVVILHGVAHNPTGMDPSREQWQQIVGVCRSRGIFPLVDLAYLGFASGDLDADSAAVRLFAEMDMEFFVAQSFSKNFGLYNERVGNLVVVSSDPAITGRVKSQLALIVRKMWSNPPSHGARVVANVLRNPALLAEWKENIKTMADRIKHMRQMLFEKLRNLGTPGNPSWVHIVQQIGMFSFSGLTKRQVEHMRQNYHVYLMPDGRVNMCGITTKNVDYVAGAIHDAVLNAGEDPKLD